MYKINEYVVYRHNVCKIKDIKENKSNNISYYVMTPIDDDSLTIKIPIDNKMGFLREIIKKEDAEILINNIQNVQPLENISDKNLDTKYKELLNTKCHDDLIKIIKTAYIRNKNRVDNKKRISEKDDTFFKLAEKYLYSELSISLNKSIEDVKEYIKEKVNN